MMRVTIRSEADRERAAGLVRTAPAGARIEIREQVRTLEQSALMWARLHDIADQLPWHGRKLTAQDYKDIFTAGLRRATIVPNIDGDGFVQLGLHTSELSKDEMSNLLDLIDAFAAERGINFKADQSSPVPPLADASAAIQDSPPAVDADATIEEASLLSPDWRHVYFSSLTSPRDRPESLLTRHTQAMQMLGGAPNGRETAWMRLAYGMVKRRNEGRMPPAQFENEKEQLLEMELPREEKAA